MPPPPRLTKALRNDPFLLQIREEAERCGSDLFLVGGFLRDLWMGKKTRDLDFLLRGNPERFLRSLSNRLGVRSVTFRKGGITNHAVVLEDRRCDFVELGAGRDLNDELGRRDFTVNTLALDLRSGILIDRFGAGRDLRGRRIRCVRPGVLADDPLRILRGIRIACELKGFTLDPETRRQMESESAGIRNVSAERVREEFDRLLLSGRAAEGLRWMRETGVLFRMIPEFVPMQEVVQGGGQNVLDHTIQAVGHAEHWPSLGRVFSFRGIVEEEDLLVLHYSLLFHDLGKPPTYQAAPDGSIHFHGHEKTSGKLAGEILARLRFPHSRSSRILNLVLHHLRVGWLTAGEPTERALRRVIRTLREDLPLLLLLSVADRKGSHPRGRKEGIRHRRVCRSLYRMYRERGQAILKPPRLITGNDVMEELRIDPGPRVGEVLRQIQELQLDGRITSRKEALRHLRTRKSGADGT